MFGISIRFHSQADEAVIRSGPVVAESVGIALSDVVKGRGVVSGSVIDDCIDDGGMSDPDTRLETTVLEKLSISVSVTVVTSICLFTTILLFTRLLGVLSDAKVAVDTTVTKMVSQSEGAAVAIDIGASVLAS